MPMPWSERVNALSINPVTAQPADVARMAADLNAAHILLMSWARTLYIKDPVKLKQITAEIAWETGQFIGKMTLP